MSFISHGDSAVVSLHKSHLILSRLIGTLRKSSGAWSQSLGHKIAGIEDQSPSPHEQSAAFVSLVSVEEALHFSLAISRLNAFPA